MITILIKTVLVLLSGMADAIIDDIDFHNYFKEKLHWLDRFWWNDDWDKKKFLGMFVINGWHIFKFICFSLLILTLVIKQEGYELVLLWYERLGLYSWYAFVFTVGFNMMFVKTDR